MYKTWNDKFELAKKYYEYHGDLKIKSNFKTKDGITYDEDGFHLGRWINMQRAQDKSGELSIKHRQMLSSIGMIFENINDLEWFLFYEQISAYLKHYHTLYISINFKTKDGITYDESGKNLGAWWRIQVYNYNKKNLSEERIKKINKLYDSLKEYESLDWNVMYEQARKYYEKYNYLIIKKKSFLIDDNNKQIDLAELKKWIKKQRKDYETGKLSKLQIEKLEKIGMIFENVTENEWERMYNLAGNYFRENGNLKISRTFKTKDGITYDKNGSALGKWLNAQYSNNVSGKLSLERKKRLETIGMHFDNQSEKKWNEMLKLASIYLIHYGNLDIPVNFKTNDGITYNEKGEQLGGWLNRQKANGIRGTISSEHRKKLEAIGLIFELYHDREWDKMYELSKIYYGENKNLNVPLNFKTKDGITYDEEGMSLGVWIHRQQGFYNTKVLADGRKKKLELIGMNSQSSHEGKWEKMYGLAKEYYCHYFNLKVSITFKTSDGYTYDANGENLGSWISAQKTSYRNGKLSEIRRKKLELIGMVFEVSKNKQQNEDICMIYDIDYKKYKREIDVIPHKEFVAKINYLKDNAIPFIINDKLHPIFFMSSMNMKVRYGLSLEQIITTIK